MSHDVLNRLGAAMNEHNVDRAAECFHLDYRSEQPAHPDRAFRGRAQMRANWTAIFAGVPDLTVDMVRSASGHDGWNWIEWTWTGTRNDGQPFDVRGVSLFEIRDGLVVAGRLYMEPVEVAGAGIEQAVRRSSGELPVEQPDDQP